MKLFLTEETFQGSVYDNHIAPKKIELQNDSYDR